MARIAAFRGARPEDVQEPIRDAWLVLADVFESVDEPTALRRRLFHELIARVAKREADAGRPVTAKPDPDPEPAVDRRRFEPPDSRWADFFQTMPVAFDDMANSRDHPATRVRATTEDALADLLLGPRVVVVLRDVAGWSQEEVAFLLGIDVAFQRRILHGGRARVRRALERLIEGENASDA